MATAAKPSDTLWRVHAGSMGQADELFLKGKVAVAFPAPDLRKFESLDALKKQLQSDYPQKTQRSIAAHAGRLWKIYREIQAGDYVLYPRKSEATFKLGQINGPYVYDAKAPGGFVHQRPVEWMTEFDRDSVSLSARREVNSLVTIIRVRRHPVEFMEATGTALAEDVMRKAEYVDASLARESTESYVLRRIAQKLKGRPFEALVADMFRVMGYQATLNPDGTNGKYDIQAGKGPLGIEPPLLKIECKSAEEQKPSHKDVAQLLTELVSNSAEQAIFISLAGFAKGTENAFRGKPIRLINKADFAALFVQLYPQLSPRFQDVIPLRQEWVPQQGSPLEADAKEDAASEDEEPEDFEPPNSDEGWGAQ